IGDEVELGLLLDEQLLIVDVVEQEHDRLPVLLQPHEALAAHLERRSAIPDALGHVGQLTSELAKLFPRHLALDYPRRGHSQTYRRRARSNLPHRGANTKLPIRTRNP